MDRLYEHLRAVAISLTISQSGKSKLTSKNTLTGRYHCTSVDLSVYFNNCLADPYNLVLIDLSCAVRNFLVD
jgi:hypothetical protein